MMCPFILTNVANTSDGLSARVQRPTSWRGCEARVHIKFCVWQGVKTHVSEMSPQYICTVPAGKRAMVFSPAR